MGKMLSVILMCVMRTSKRLASIIFALPLSAFFFFQNFGCQQFFGEIIAKWYAIAVYFLGAFEQVAVCHEIDFRYADF